MTRREKILRRFLSKPKDFSWGELVTLLRGYGYEQLGGGKTGGSRARFLHESLPPIILHRPHPSPVLKRYQLDQVEEVLKEEGLL
jgi:hypothetical protein